MVDEVAEEWLTEVVEDAELVEVAEVLDELVEDALLLVPDEVAGVAVVTEESEEEVDTVEEEEDEEAAAELTAKYSRRQLGTNADRYQEPEPELDSDGVFEWYLL